MQVFGDKIRFVIQATPMRIPYAEYRDNWLLCERLGYDAVYSTDHLVSYQIARYGLPAGRTPVLEGPTLISAMAAQTSRMRCGIMVASNTFRNPAILAKIATTLDHVSNGRFELGMGAGHTEIEHEMYRIPLYTQGKRLRMMAEAIKLVRSLLTNESTTFEGEYYKLEEAFCEPKPVQRPLPFLVGGTGEKLTLRIVAESADIWNVWDFPSREEYAHKLEALRGHCEDVVRDPRDIRKSMHFKPVIGEDEADIMERLPQQDRARSHGTPEEVAEHMLSFVRMGVSDILFRLDYPADYRSLELMMTRVAPIVRQEGERILADRMS